MRLMRSEGLREAVNFSLTDVYGGNSAYPDLEIDDETCLL